MEKGTDLNDHREKRKRRTKSAPPPPLPPSSPLFATYTRAGRGAAAAEPPASNTQLSLSPSHIARAGQRHSANTHVCMCIHTYTRAERSRRGRTVGRYASASERDEINRSRENYAVTAAAASRFSLARAVALVYVRARAWLQCIATTARLLYLLSLLERIEVDNRYTQRRRRVFWFDLVVTSAPLSCPRTYICIDMGYRCSGAR